jgi:serine/threonine protein kinase
MDVDEPTPLDQEFASRLAAYDEALAAGTSAHASQETKQLAPELQPRLQRGFEFLQVLQQLRPSYGLSSRSFGAEPARTRPSSDEVPLTNLGRFRIVKELGRGAYGIVFLACDPELGRNVALKIPRAEALVSPAERERFLREARAAAALDHPNLVAVYEVGAVGPISFIASAYCPGMTLAQCLKQRDEPVPPRTAARLVAMLADGLEHAHQHGIIHRDLKPSNVLLVAGDPQGSRHETPAAEVTADRDLVNVVPKIADFGLAKLFVGERLLAASEAQTQSGAIVGTPAYMAPEQAGGKSRTIGPEADVYALGVLLYELLTGRPPFRADSPWIRCCWCEPRSRCRRAGCGFGCPSTWKPSA